MYRRFRKLFGHKKRSKSCPHSPAANVDQLDEPPPDPCPSLKLADYPRWHLQPDEHIVMHTTAEVHPRRQQPPAGKRHLCEASDRLAGAADMNTRQAIQIFRRGHEPDDTFDEEQLESTRDNEMHRFILEDVAEFYQQFANLQTDVRILISKNVIIYVLGTNHANTQCKEDVVEIIKKVRICWLTDHNQPQWRPLNLNRRPNSKTYQVIGAGHPSGCYHLLLGDFNH